MMIRSLCACVVSSALAAAAAGQHTSDASAASPTSAAPQIQATTWIDPRPVTPLPSSGPGAAAGPAVTFLTTNEDPEGDLPRAVVFTPDGSQVLVINRDTDALVFFDVETRTATETVIVGDFPTDVAVTPDGQYALTPNVFDNSVSVVDIAGRSVVATVPVTGEQPFAVAVTSDSARAIVAVINDGVSSSFSVIDLNTMSETLSFPSAPQGVLGFFFTPESGISGNIFSQFALAPDDSVIVLPDRGNSQVKLYDPDTGAEVDTLATAALPTSVDISADSTTAVIGHEGNAQTITEIDLVASQVTGSFATGQSLQSQVVRITPDKTHAMAAISNNVIFVNLTSGAVTSTVETGVVGDIRISFDGQYAFVSNFNARVIDIASQSIVKTIPLAACVDAATSPVELRAVALNNRFREDVQFYDIDGAQGFAEGLALSGEPNEGDATRNLSISSDGDLLAACNNTSRNVCLIDLDTETVRSYVDVGERPLDVAIAPDESVAVVCATDDNSVKIIDLSTDTVVASLPIFNRPARVRISPDSQRAYVLNVAGTDRISFIDLDGPASSITAQVSAGQTGSALGYSYTETSGIELSDDGSVLAVCDSFNDLLRLYSTDGESQLAAVPVGDFPIRVAFSPSGTRAYVANAFGDSLTVVNVNGPASGVIWTVLGIEFPLIVETDGSFVYVGNTDGSNPGLHVINAANNFEVLFLPLPDPARASHLGIDGTLYLATTGGELVRVNAAGAGSTIIDATPLSSSPSDMVFSDAAQLAAAAQPIPDGVDLYHVAGAPCPADTNGDGEVDVQDLTEVILSWGDAGGPGDVNGDDIVDVQDLTEVVLAWGPCV